MSMRRKTKQTIIPNNNLSIRYLVKKKFAGKLGEARYLENVDTKINK
jgi:hypothetical protein